MLIKHNKVKNLLYTIVNKPIGETPLQTIQRFKRKFRKYKDVKIGYAGRLDPMAEGKLLLLLGDENKRKKVYENLNKTYVFNILFGFSTDSYDLLGIVTKYSIPKTVDYKKLKKIHTSFVGTISLPYPYYSSYRVNGKPLYYWTRKNKLSEISIPLRKSVIYSCSLVNIHLITIQKLQSYLHSVIPSIKGDFRQKEILEKWDKILTKLPPKTQLNLAVCEANVSSGTYIRAIVNKIGEDLNIPTVTYSIKRTKIHSPKNF